ncbi:hypothetical protein [Palleronia caenipelagi]|uniref:Uncharacterized protein n=1 Tax=Palleronia caenipelagi TaxID=2489174 RepID=A0A547PUI2_9RHOB|nr:hypothetical protein [Palleronia caenipelagi]TRD17809.1 hypothetical protein FEV53_12655 [Palleronia caenipelagi]
MKAAVAPSLSSLTRMIVALGRRQSDWNRQLHEEMSATRAMIAMLAATTDEELSALMERTNLRIEQMRLSPDHDLGKQQLELDLEEQRQVMARMERERGPDGDPEVEREDEHER